MAYSLKDLKSLDDGSFELIRQQTREEANGDENLASDLLTRRTLTTFIEKLRADCAGSHARDHPLAIRDIIESLNGTDLKFLIKKHITKTDLNPRENRLLMPEKLMQEEFLTEEEKKILKQGRGLGVTVIEPCFEITTNLQLKEWIMGKRLYFALIGNWSSIAENKKNHLEPGCMVKFWSFRKDSNLYFVLVKA
ncbi:hypothetical protein ACOSQ4_011471 [Xanthoceras sorbifolium]